MGRSRFSNSPIVETIKKEVEKLTSINDTIEEKPSRPIIVERTPLVNESSSFIATKPTQKSAYQLQLEKIARTQAHKERSVEESLDIHTKKISGISAGNTDNYFVNNKTGESSKRASDVTSVNLNQYLQERGLTTLSGNKVKTVKLTEERMASKTRESLLRKQAEIKALGGQVPNLDLRNNEQVSKYNEISNIITQSKPDTSQNALQDVTSKISNFLSIDNPITQTPKTRGVSQVGITGIEDTSVISQGFTPNALGETEVSEQTNEDENFIAKKGLGIAGVGLGIGALALIYYLLRRQ
jgi:hypothetical protein